MKRFFLAVACFCACLIYGLNSVAIAEVSSESVRELLEKLDSSKLAERNEAEDGLFKLGSEVERFLPDETDPGLSSEQLNRIKSLKRRFDRSAVDAARKEIDFELKSISKRERKSFDGEETVWMYWFTVETKWSKEVFPIRFKYPMNEVSAIDPNGNKLLPESPKAKLEAPVNPGQFTTSLRFALESKLNAETSDFVLTAKPEALLAIRPQVFSFDNPLEIPRTELRKGELRITLETAYQDGEETRVRARIHFENPYDAIQSHRNWVLDNPALLHLEGGEPLEAKRYRSLKRTEIELILEYVYIVPKNTKIVRWTYESPSMFREEPIEIELKLQPESGRDF